VDETSLAGISTPTVDGSLTAQTSRPTNVQDAAQQFEALLLSEIMRSERESGSGWLGSGEDSSGASAVEFAEQQLALVLARQGGLGLAGLISSGLESSSGS
jgi:Rod binding domain-containing protein